MPLSGTGKTRMCGSPKFRIGVPSDSLSHRRLSWHHRQHWRHLFLKLLQWRQRNLCFPVAVVPQSQLRETFGITANFGPFRPCVTVAVQRHTLNAKADTALLKLCCPIPCPHRLQIWKQRAGFRQRSQNFLHLLAKSNLRWLLAPPARFHPNKADNPRLPVHVLGLQVCQVRLRRAQMPCQLVKRLPFRVLLARYNLAVFLQVMARLSLNRRQAIGVWESMATAANSCPRRSYASAGDKRSWTRCPLAALSIAVRPLVLNDDPAATEPVPCLWLLFASVPGWLPAWCW
jgi:hypothetical protein